MPAVAMPAVALMPARSRRFFTTPRHEHAGDYSGGELQLEDIEGVIQGLFLHYDADSSGYLDRDEFRNLLRDLKEKVSWISDDDLYYFMAEADLNDDGMIEYKTFIQLYCIE